MGDTVEVLCKVKDIDLIKIFFDHDLEINETDFQRSRIFDYETFYKLIDYKKCFTFVIKHNNNNDDFLCALSL